MTLRLGFRLPRHRAAHPPMSSSDLSERDHALLVLGADGAEWREHSAATARAARSACGPEGVSALASAAVEARALAGGVQKRVVLVLGEPFVHVRVFVLPELARAERERVFARKAASLAGASQGDVVFAVHGGGAHSGASGRWLVAAARRTELAALVEELAARGLRVTRIVPARLAALPREFWDSASDLSRLGVTCDERGASLWLAARGGPLHVGGLARGPAGESALLAAVLQEVRSCVAYARRTLRGAQISSVALDGFDPEDAERLDQALANVLAGVTITHATSAELTARRDAAARSAALAAFDLSPARGPRRWQTTALVSAALAVTIGLAAVVHVRIGSAQARLATELRGLEAQRAPRAGAASADHLHARLDRCETRVAELERARAGASEFTQRVAALARVFGDDAALLSLTSSADGSFVVEGLVDARPLVALAALERVSRRIASTPGLGQAHVELAGPRAADAGPGEQRFTLRLERAP